MAHMVLRCSFVLVLATSLCPLVAFGGRPSEELFPNTTKGFISVPDLEKLTTAWNSTDLGKMVNDPAMEPFVEDLRRQLKAKFSQAGIRLGVTFEDLSGVASGEVALASLQPGGVKTACATVLVADITGRDDKAQELLNKIAKNLTQKGATQGKTEIGGVSFSAFKLPVKKPSDRAVTAFYSIHQNTLIAVDDLDTAGLIIKNFTGEQSGVLKSVPAFQTAMTRSREGLKADPHVRWFVEPFGYIEVVRAYQGGRKKRGTDMLKVLSTQGFNAIQGLGGQVALATEQHEIQHQSFIYAPAVKRESGDAGMEKYRLAARMLDFPNTEALQPQKWVPKRLGTYLTFSWDLQKAFWSSETLVNEVAGDDVFQDVIKSIETDPNGPRINVAQEFVKFLSKRATIISDYQEPVDTKSERVLFAIEVTDPQTVMATVNKAMESDPDAKKIVVEGHTIWEMTQEEEFADVEEIKIDGADAAGDVEVDVEEEKKFRPNAAVTVAHGHLLISTHVDYLVRILKQPADGEGLENAPDFQRVMKALQELGSKEDSFRLFSRTDHSYRVTYEMIRQNKMPEAETLLGKALNELFAPEEEDTLRENQLDGTKLPEFAKVQKYLGPSGLYLRTQDDGWMISGCLLKRGEDAQ